MKNNSNNNCLLVLVLFFFFLLLFSTTFSVYSIYLYAMPVLNKLVIIIIINKYFLTLCFQCTLYTHGLDFILHSKYTSAPSRIIVEFMLLPSSRDTTGKSSFVYVWGFFCFFVNKIESEEKIVNILCFFC